MSDTIGPGSDQGERQDELDNLRAIAESVSQRARSLLPVESGVTVTAEFVRGCLDANERGDGVLYATINAGQFLVNVTPTEWEWYTWGGNVWQLDDTRRSFAAVEEVALEYEAQAEVLSKEINEQGVEKKGKDGWKVVLRDKYRSRVDRLRTANGANKALTWAPIVDHQHMTVREAEFDCQPMLLPVKNGVINLATGALEAGRPADRLTKSLDIEYDPFADYSPWLQFLKDICADQPGLPEFIQRSFGYAITGHAYEQYIWVFIGPGRNGKGVLFNLIGEILGPYYHEIARGMILEQRNEPPPSATSEHLYSLLGKRLAVGSETNKGQKIDLAAVKRLTGEDKITCRPNYRGEVSFMPTHSLFLHTNHMPIGLTRDFAILQRLLKIELPNMYVDDPEQEAKKQPLRAAVFRKKDPLLKEKLRGCRQGILRWLVDGCLMWQRDGIAPPQQVADWVAKEAADNDFTGQFLADCVVMAGDPEDRIAATELYQAFSWWWSVNMDSREQRLPALKTLTGSLRDMGHDVKKKGGKTYVYGLQINSEVAGDVAGYVPGK